MKVWSQKDMTNLHSMLETDWLDEERFGTLIFNRKTLTFDVNDNNKITEMTLEEICSALGKNVKIIPTLGFPLHIVN